MFSLFNEAAKKFATRDAVVEFDGTNTFSYTYQELLEASSVVCQHLKDHVKNTSHRGRQIIAISFSNQSAIHVAILLGILKNGSAFILIPFSELIASFSNENLRLNLGTTYVFIQKTQTSLDHLGSHLKVVDEFPVLGNAIYLCKWEEENNTQAVAQELDCAKGSIVYAIQTSGTTGCKKTVLVTENCILPNIHDFVKIFSLDENDIVLLAAPFTFDPSIIDIFITLTTGAVLIILADSVKSHPPLLLDVLFPTENLPNVLKNYKLSVLQTTPSLFQRWTQSEICTRILNDNSTLKVLTLGGEECIPLKTLKACKSDSNRTMIFNLYGLTEMSCWASCWKINFSDLDDGSDKIPLGNPLTDTYFKIDLDEMEIDDGEKQIGELVLGTQERICFVNDETTPISERKTGDLVMTSNGSFYFIGRKDRIVKFYGIRINLQEIEDKLKKLDTVANCHCICKLESCILYVLLMLKDGVNQNEVLNVKSYFHCTFGHSIPPFYQLIVVEEFPVTHHGKFWEEEMLKILASSQTKRKIRYNLKDIIKKFRDIWFSFNLETCGGFKDLGGNSLIAAEIISILDNKFSDKERFKFLNLLLSNGTFIESLRLLKSLILKQQRKKTRVKLKSIFKFKYSSKFLSLQKHKFMRAPFFLSPRKMYHSQRLYFKVVYFKPKNVEKKLKKSRLSSQNFRKVQNSKNQSSSVIARGAHFSTNYLSQLETLEFTDFDRLKIRVVWKKYLMSCVDNSPVILHSLSGKSHVVISSHHGTFSTFDAISGDLITSYNFKTDIVSSAFVASSSFCSRIFSYIGCFDGRFCKINNLTGKIIWCFKSNSLIKTRAVLVADSVYFASYDLNLYCLNKQTGKLRWKLFVGDKGIHANLLFIAKWHCICVCTLSGHIHMVDIKTRKLKWVNEMTYPIFSSPCLLAGYDRMIVASVNGFCCCFDVETGRKIWSLELNQPIYADVVSGPCEEIEKTFLCVTQEGTVICYSVTDDSPAEQWKIDLCGKFSASPFIFPLSYKQASSQKLFAVALVTTSGMISLISLSSGNKLGELALPGEVFSSPVVYFDYIFVGCRDNNLYCLKIEAGLE